MLVARDHVSVSVTCYPAECGQAGVAGKLCCVKLLTRTIKSNNNTTPAQTDACVRVNKAST